MAISIEQFTAPGKYSVDLAMEKINKIVNTPTEIKYEDKKNSVNQGYKLNTNYKNKNGSN